MLSVLTPEYLLTSFVVVLLPGAGVIYTLSHGLFVSGRASVLAAFGCTLSIVPHILASVLGLAAVLHASALAFQALKIFGVLYLLYLAWGLWRSSGAVSIGESIGVVGSSRSIVAKGFLMNILNPKLSVFFLAFLPHFVPVNAVDPLTSMTVLSACFVLMTFFVFAGYGLAAGTLRTRVLSSVKAMRWLQRCFGMFFAGFAVKLALTDR